MLEEEIREKSSKIFRDAYQMSIGELMNIYRDGEMDIHPEFQRVFRWTTYQKTKLIESIMLNIPIPSIFVSQNEEGVWDVIDGVQRLSTIFQFTGIFKDDEGMLVEPLVLEKTDYLPSFENMTWENGDNNFTREQKIDFKRARIDVIIVKKESDPNTKYELFQRLNTGGTQLSDQEVRNCLMIMTDRTFYQKVHDLSNDENFGMCVPITDRKEDEQFKMELVLRAQIACQTEIEVLRGYTDLSELLDKETLKLASNMNKIEDFIPKFQAIFLRLSESLGENSFRKYDNGKFKGAFLVSSYQCIVSGAILNYDSFINLSNDELCEKVQNLYLNDRYIENMKPGARAIPRFIDLTNLGKEYFA